MPTTTVKVSNRYQIVVPSAARAQLDIQSGDRLIVDIQDGMLILIPEPQDYTNRLTGLHREIWEDQDAGSYLDRERDAWQPSENG